MCNLHTHACNESLTLKIGTINIRQLLRLYPGSWLEAGSISVPELRINAKFECHPPSPANIHEQMEFLRRHDQHSQRLHFLYHSKSQSTSANNTIGNNFKRTSNVGLASTSSPSSCACLGGSSAYYTLVQGEQFFKNTYHLAEQTSFGRSLFRPDVHVVYSHSVFEQKYSWPVYNRTSLPDESLLDEEIFYPFDFCAQPKQNTEQRTDNHNAHLRQSVPANLYSLSRSNSSHHIKPKSFVDTYEHKRSSSSIPLNPFGPSSSLSSSASTNSDVYLTPNERLSMTSSSRSSLNSTLIPTTGNHMDTSSMSSATIMQPSISSLSSPLHSHMNLLSRSHDNHHEGLHAISSHSSSSSDSLNVLEEILQRQQTNQTSTFLPEQQVRHTCDNKRTCQSCFSSFSDGHIVIRTEFNSSNVVICIFMDKFT
jgi:hypothetical protein